MSGAFYNSEQWQRERVRILFERDHTSEECGGVQPRGVELVGHSGYQLRGLRVLRGLSDTLCTVACIS